MKFLILVCVVFASALALTVVDKEAAKASAHKLKAASDTCNEDPATKVVVDREALKKSHREGKPEKPANSGPHAFCVSKIVGWQNDDGVVNKEVIRSRAVAIYGESEELEKQVNECTKFEGSNEEVAEHLLGCYLRFAPRPPRPSDNENV